MRSMSTRSTTKRPGGRVAQPVTARTTIDEQRSAHAPAARLQNFRVVSIGHAWLPRYYYYRLGHEALC